MKSYVITYRKPDGTMAERHISAAGHKAAVSAFLEQGLGDPIRVERADDGYDDEGGFGKEHEGDAARNHHQTKGNVCKASQITQVHHPLSNSR